VATPEAAATAEAGPAEAAAADVAPADVAPPAPAAPTPAPADPRLQAFEDVLFLVGSVWRAMGDERRAALAFAQSGRKSEQRDAVKTLEKSGDWQEQARVLTEQGRTRDAARIYEKNKS